jgi:hypothetical protein
MTEKDIMGAASIAISAYTYTVYISGILRGRTRPHVFSWAVWALLLVVTFLAQMVKGAGPGSWVTGFDAAACLAIMLLALKRGETHITRSDWCAFLGGVAAIPLWLVTGDPLLSVILNTAITVFGFWPTVRKSWSAPWSEVVRSYMLAGPAFVLSLAALESVTWTTALYPAVMMVVNVGFACMLLLRRHQLQDSKKSGTSS